MISHLQAKIIAKMNFLREKNKKFILGIDVGTSNIAPFTKSLLKSSEDFFVLGIDPNVKSILELENDEILKQHKDRVLILNCGIADTNSSLECRLFNQMKSPHDGCSSFLEPTKKLLGQGVEVEQKYTVPVHSLESLLDYIDFSLFKTTNICLKSDSQGYELEVYRSLGRYKDNIVFYDYEATTNESYIEAPTRDEITNEIKIKNLKLIKSLEEDNNILCN